MRGGNVRTIVHNGETITIPVEWINQKQILHGVYGELIMNFKDSRITNDEKEN